MTAAMVAITAAAVLAAGAALVLAAIAAMYARRARDAYREIRQPKAHYGDRERGSRA